MDRSESNKTLLTTKYNNNDELVFFSYRHSLILNYESLLNHIYRESLKIFD